MNPGALISLVITGLAVLAIIIGLLIGLKRRTYRALLRLASYILSAVIALFISLPIASAVYNAVWTAVLEAVPSLNDLLATFASSAVFNDLLSALPAMIIAMLLYAVIFSILSLLMLIPYCIVARKVVNKEVKSSFKGDRLVGMAVGAVSGLLVLAILLAPLASVLRFSSGLTAMLPAEENGEPNAVTEIMDDVTGNWFIVTSALLGDGINFYLTTTNIGGATVHFGQEAYGLLGLYTSISPYLSEEMDLVNMLTAVTPHLTKSTLVCAIAADMISGLATAWTNNEEFMGIPPMEAEGIAGTLLNDALLILKDSTPDTIKEDLATVSSLLETMDKYEVLDAFGSEEGADMMELLKKDGFISDLLETVASNDRMSGLLASVVNVGIQMLGEYMNIPANKATVRDQFFADVSAALNESANNKKQMATKLGDALETAGIEVDDSLVPVIANALCDTFKGSGDITTEDLEEFFSIALDLTDGDDTVSGYGFVFVSTSSLQQKAESLRSQLKQMIADNPALETASLVGLKSVDTFVTTVTTMEDYQVAADVLANMSEEELKTEMSNLSSGITNIAKFISSTNTEEGEEFDISNLDLKALGAAVDGLLGSALIGDVAKDLTKSMLNSDLLGDLPITIPEEDLDEMLNNNELKMEDLFEAAQKTTEIVVNMGKDDSAGQEKLEENVEWLISNLSPTTATALKLLLNADMLKAYGVPEKYAENICYTLGMLFDKMANSSSMTTDEYKAEASAIKSLFNLILEPNKDIDLETVITTVMNSKVILSTIDEVCKEKGTDPLKLGNSIDKNAVKKDLKTYVQGHYNGQADKAAFKAGIISIGKLCGVDVSSSFDSWVK